MSDPPLQKSELVSSYGFEPPLGRDGIVDGFEDGKRPPWEDKILVGELHHRLQNALSIVMALSRLTARSVNTIDEFQTAFSRRIEAMGRTNALLLRGQVQAVSVEAALEAELRPYLLDDGQVTLDCDPANVDSDVALNLSLIFHELATNAAKYGALSTPTGRLIVSCQRGGDTCTLSWQEIMTTPVPPATREGGGTVLISRLARALGGAFRFSLEPGGLQAGFTFRCSS
jgi:two-component sensor histidine kinase